MNAIANLASAVQQTPANQSGGELQGSTTAQSFLDALMSVATTDSNAALTADAGVKSKDSSVNNDSRRAGANKQEDRDDDDENTEPESQSSNVRDLTQTAQVVTVDLPQNLVKAAKNLTDRILDSAVQTASDQTVAATPGMQFLLEESGNQVNAEAPDLATDAVQQPVADEMATIQNMLAEVAQANHDKSVATGENTLPVEPQVDMQCASDLHVEQSFASVPQSGISAEVAAASSALSTAGGDSLLEVRAALLQATGYANVETESQTVPVATTVAQMAAVSQTENSSPTQSAELNIQQDAAEQPTEIAVQVEEIGAEIAQNLQGQSASVDKLSPRGQSESSAVQAHSASKSGKDQKAQPVDTKAQDQIAQAKAEQSESNSAGSYGQQQESARQTVAHVEKESSEVSSSEATTTQNVSAPVQAQQTVAPDVTAKPASNDQNNTPQAANTPTATSDEVRQVLNTARLVQSANQAEMRVGLTSSEFGKISISTSSTRNSISTQILVDHTELAKTLSSQLTEFQSKQSSVPMEVRVDMHGASMNLNSGNSEQQNASQGFDGNTNGNQQQSGSRNQPVSIGSAAAEISAAALVTQASTGLVTAGHLDVSA